jgi:hypothetical protein
MRPVEVGDMSSSIFQRYQYTYEEKQLSKKNPALTLKSYSKQAETRHGVLGNSFSLSTRLRALAMDGAPGS